MKSIRTTIILSFIFTFATSIYAQKTFQPGKIIIDDNDSLTGLIDSKSETALFKECKFRTDKTSPIITYTPLTIKAFSVSNGTVRKFVRAKIATNSKYVFLEVLCEGEINLYYYKEGQLHFFIQKKGESALHSLPYERSERYIDNGYSRQMKTVETTYHIDTLKLVMQDKPTLYPEIEKIQSPEKKNLLAIVNKYSSNTLTYSNPEERKQPQILSQLELLRAGKINLYTQKDSASEPHFYIKKGAESKLIELPFKKMESKQYQGMLIHSYTDITTNHIDTLKKYMADATPLFGSIEEIRTPSKTKLEKLIDEYNSYTDENTYNQKHSLKRLPLNLDVVPGLYFTFIQPENPIVRLGAFINLGLLNSNKHFFLKTGLFVFKANTPLTDKYFTNSANYMEYYAPEITYQIPLQFEYRFTENMFQPLISLGYNLYLIKEIKPYNKVLLPVITPGVNIQMGKRFSIRLGIEFEFKNNDLLSYFPQTLKRGNLFTGLQIKL